MNKKISFKKGVASFYIIIFATLILVVVASSFAAIIISEVERTSNDDLAQSAYDSAMAGVEDAKLAYYAYQTCMDNGGSVNGIECSKIEAEFKNYDKCNRTKYILGKAEGADDTDEVKVKEETSSGDGDMQQAYTCVKMTDVTDSYVATLTSNNNTKVIRANEFTDEDGNSIPASEINHINVSWYSDANAGEAALNFGNFDESKVDESKVVFGAGSADGEAAVSTPPTLMVGLVQTSEEEFSMSDFNISRNGQTNRGAVYMVPVQLGQKPGSDGETYNVSTEREGITTDIIEASALVKSNDKTSENKPYLVSCDPNSTTGYICSARIDLPAPINGDRKDDTFAIVLSLPYGQPETDVEVSFCTSNNCTGGGSGGGGTEESTEPAKLSHVQVKIDSTGRANDLYRRVVTYLDNGNEFKISGMAAIEILGSAATSTEGGSSNEGGLVKNIYTTKP